MNLIGSDPFHVINLVDQYICRKRSDPKWNKGRSDLFVGWKWNRSDVYRDKVRSDI